MKQTARSWRVTVAGLAVGAAGVLGLASPTASADPVFPPRPNPAPAAPMPQAVAVVPGAVGNPMPGAAAAAPVPGSPALAPAPQGLPPAPPVAAPPVAAPPVAAPPELAPATSGTLREFFASKNVKLEPQQAKDFKALDLTLPMPQGWTQVPDPNVPDAFVVTANRHSSSLYTPNAQLVVYRLVGDFDPKEAITHGYLDSQQLADFNGSPSSIIEGTYRQNEMTLNTSHRNVIVTSGPDKYLVSLAVTTEAGGTVAEAPATDGIINGFRAGPPGSNAPAAPPPAPAAPAPPALPAAPPAVVAPPQALSH
jgi:hypothetical protein